MVGNSGSLARYGEQCYNSVDLMASTTQRSVIVCATKTFRTYLAMFPRCRVDILSPRSARSSEIVLEAANDRKRHL